MEEATQLIEAGFQYVTEINEAKLFRKLKTSYLGTYYRSPTLLARRLVRTLSFLETYPANPFF